MTVDLATLKRDRIASQCVCCGSEDLTASPAILMPFVADRIFGWKPVTIDESWGLRTIGTGRAFPICKTMKCNVCGHLFCDIRFSDGELQRLYDKYREADYTALRDQYEPGYAARNTKLNDAITYLPDVEAFVRPFLSGPLTILDWGGDTGINTPFKGEAMQVDVYDISNKAPEPGVRMVSYQEATSHPYALVVCSMVLEHVPYPSDILLAAQGALGPDSIFYLEVPFEEVMRSGLPDYNLHKRHWHEHINFYSRESMRRLVENCGLEIVASNVLVTVVAGSEVHVMQVACRLAR